MRRPALQHLFGCLPTVLRTLPNRGRLWQASAASRWSSSTRNPVSDAQKPSLTDFGLETDGDTFIPGITADPFFKELNLPKRCIGCGALFQTSDATKPGYVSNNVLLHFGARGAAKEPRLGGIEVDRAPEGVQVDKCDDGRFQRLRRRAVCRRCYRLQYYKRVDTDCEPDSHRLTTADVDAKSRDKPDRLVNATPCRASGLMQMPQEAEQHRAAESARVVTAPEVISGMTRRMRSDGLVLYLVDITNVEATTLPELYIALRNKAMEVIWIANKVDVLPRKTELPVVKRWLRSMVRHIGNAKNSDVFLVSSTKGTGFEALERRLKEFLKVGDARNIYVVGAVNAGKSTFVNRFLSYISYGDAGTLHIKRGIGGATRSAIPGTTLEFIEFGLFGGFKLIDTPGVPISSTMTQLLRRPLDILAMQMTKTLDPLVVRLDAGQSLLLGAVVRVDLIQGSAMNLQCFVGAGVTATVCRTVAAADVMKNRAGTRIFPPHSKDDFERLSTFAAHRLTVNCSGALPIDDLVIPGLGWLAPTGNGPKTIEIHVPKGVDVLRRPAIVTHTARRAHSIHVLRRRGRLKKLLKMRSEINQASE